MELLTPILCTVATLRQTVDFKGHISLLKSEKLRKPAPPESHILLPTQSSPAAQSGHYYAKLSRGQDRKYDVWVTTNKELNHLTGVQDAMLGVHEKVGTN
jgi:hypothetical protein